MKLGSIFPCLLLWASINALHAQPKSRIYLSDLYILTGGMHQQSLSLSLADYKLLAPESVLLKNDLSSFSTYDSRYRNNTMGGRLFSMLAGINFARKPNLQLRAGFTTFREDMSELSYSKVVRKAYDTLISGQTGKEYFIDSVKNTSYRIQHSRQQFRLEASLIYRTNPERRWSFHAGVGAAASFSLNSNTDIAYNFSNYTQERNGELSKYDVPFYSSGYSKYESFKNKNVMSYALFAPIGLDFRVGKSHSVWSKIHIVYEVRPSMYFTKTEKTIRASQLNVQQNIGLRLVLTK